MTGGRESTVRALVVDGPGAPPTVRPVRLPAPGAGQVRVRVRAAGVCHSDLSMADGTIAAPYPLVLGHEAAGVVVVVGPEVTRVAPGAHVVLNWAPPCRACWFCGRDEPWLCAATGGVTKPKACSGLALRSSNLEHADRRTTAASPASRSSRHCRRWTRSRN